VHRDLKPSNVFLARTPEAPAQVKVLDFGIAAGEPSSTRSPTLTRVEQLLGTPAYMSPEQMLASHDVTCLQKPREERFASMHDLSGALRTACAF
jgi:eukaryotic-like serine/threonine-protein kinase